VKGQALRLLLGAAAANESCCRPAAAAAAATVQRFEVTSASYTDTIVV
jgi:hypothetical protein